MKECSSSEVKQQIYSGNFVESLASSTFSLVAPLMKSHQSDAQHHSSHVSFHSLYQSKDEQIVKTDDVVDKVWPPFGGDSAFEDSSDHDGSSQPLTIPIDVLAPDSSTPVMLLSAEDDLMLAFLPDNGFSYGAAFPGIISSDSGLEEVSRRFKI